MIPKRNIRFATLATAAIGALFPTALSAQDAHIQDPNTGIYARVHPDRYLQTYDERANMDEDPQRFIRFRGYAIRDCLPLATPPVARSLIIKTVIVNSFRMEDPVTSDAVSLFLGVNGCEENLFTFNRSGIGATSHNFEPGFVVPSGQTLWVIRPQSPLTRGSPLASSNSLSAQTSASSRSGDLARGEAVGTEGAHLVLQRRAPAHASRGPARRARRPVRRAATCRAWHAPSSAPRAVDLPDHRLHHVAALVDLGEDQVGAQRS
jgi:hypothetical protein